MEYKPAKRRPNQCEYKNVVKNCSQHNPNWYCSRCRKWYCMDHRLPENHNCPNPPDKAPIPDNLPSSKYKK